MDTANGSAKHAFGIEEFLALAEGPAGASLHLEGKLSPEARRYLKLVHEDAEAEDVDGLSIEDVLACAVRFWEFGKVRKPGETLAQINPGKTAGGAPLGRDVLNIIIGDKPFLVDSVMGELGQWGVNTLAMFHPVIDLGRTKSGERDSKAPAIRESMIQVQFEPLSDKRRQKVLDGVLATLRDVELAVDDWMGMRAEMNRAIEELHEAPAAAPEEEVAECIEFLRWLRDEHFAFLGSRRYTFPIGEDGELLHAEPDIVVGSGLGLLRDDATNVLRRGSEPSMLAPAIQDFLNEPTPLIVAKSNMRSRVHRRIYMDYIGVKHWREDGQVTGETRFVGLFTAEAYDRMARDVPLIRRKVRRVLMRAQRGPGTHNAKKLQNIVENYPRDELFQISEAELLEISRGILHLNDRPRPKLFVRRDRFDRFVSVFVFIPREHYNTQLREDVGELVRASFGGRLSAYYPHFGDGPLARVHIIIGLDPHNHLEPDLAELERQIALLARTWHDRLESAARRKGAPVGIAEKLGAYRGAFSAGYKEAYHADESLTDIAHIEALNEAPGLSARLYRHADDEEDIVRIKLYKTGHCLPLSDVMPIFDTMGFEALTEASYPVRAKDRDPVWVHAFEMRCVDAKIGDLTPIAAPVEEALVAIWGGRSENDGFNRLVLRLGVNWRSVAFLRTCARYRAQSGLDPSQRVQEEALAENPEISSLLLELARTRFHPDAHPSLKKRKAAQEKICTKIIACLEKVPSLDHDRVLRRLMRLICAIQRTSFYQKDAEGQPLDRISIKIASRELETLPAPKPYREIFVWSPAVEGVHLRFGPVARGGLRWSDRRDDFRTEVLGLVKAQQVKNSVIVPVGSKGGFFPKNLPRGGNRDAIQAEGIHAYKTFIRGLLDLTDTINTSGEIVHPDHLVIWDEDDPYLVVAADKGTATFSDIANAMAEEYGFWLDDAFASGGSVGYDHKKMGITARGAWEAVKRHFREMGTDIQTEAFTAIGVGDMSGDVFGNGMLLSKETRLLAAFDHRDIFIDPDPKDNLANWAERKRLFDLSRSSWQDYDATLISKGGGIFSRRAKSVPLSAQMRALTGLKGDTAAPNDIIHALLQAECGLLWFGGIGTYVKSAEEQDWQVSDKANDAIRVSAGQVRAKVIGEGANLGITHAGRIAFAKNGGRINADFVDNSAGVDTSDHEVNLKILLNTAIRAGTLTLEGRNTLLASMTKDVAKHVLAHNYDQTLALSMAQLTAPYDMEPFERFMGSLEEKGQLDRVVEGLPSSDEMLARREAGEALTRPEIATLMAYAKNTLVEELLDSDLPDDAHFEPLLTHYFPKPARTYKQEREHHRLRREIISTVLVNDIVNQGGPTFIYRLAAGAGVSVADAARAFEASRHLFDFDALIARINGYDNKAPVKGLYELHREVMRLVRRESYWLARRFGDAARDLDAFIAQYQGGIQGLCSSIGDFISPYEQERITRRIARFEDDGAPADLARDIAMLRPMISATDVLDISGKENWPVESVAALYHAFGDQFRFDRLRGAAGGLDTDQRWDRLAVRRLIEDLYSAQRGLTSSAIHHAAKNGNTPKTSGANREWAQALVHAWKDANGALAIKTMQTFDELDATGEWTLAKLAIANTQMSELAAQIVT
jgi:glutamate dehydrogenase